MPTLILDGRIAREVRMPELAARIKALMKPPHLAIIQVGDRPDTAAYIRAKKSFAEKIGARVKHIQLPENVSEGELVATVDECNADASIQGIIVQLPLPIAIDHDSVIESIDPGKDADGLTAANVKRWMEGREDAVIPATARGVKELLDHYQIGLFGKHVVVVGRSMLVGKPIASIALNENATVTVVHSKTPNVADITNKADVLIIAAGKPKLIGADHVKQGAAVIDVGINTLKGEKLEEEIDEDPDAGRSTGQSAPQKLVGDADFEAVKDIASAITPVPGGVGPMTVLALFENLADLCTPLF